MKQDIVFSNRDCLICGKIGHPKRFFSFYVFGQKIYCVQCRNCGLIYVNPMPILSLDILDDLYSEKLLSDYQRMSSGPDIPMLQITKNAMEKQIREIKKYTPQGKILDVGCGSGWFLKVSIENGYEAFGTEVSKRLCDYVKTQGINIFHGFLEEARFDAKLFDFIHLRHVIEHLPNPDAVFKEAKRILKDDGLVFVQSPNTEILNTNILLHANKFLGGGKLREASIPDPPYHLYGFSLKNITSLLQRTGFRIVKSFIIKGYHKIYWAYDPEWDTISNTKVPIYRRTLSAIKHSLIKGSQFVIFARKS